MRRIVTLVLMMLIGGYGAAQAQTPTPTPTPTPTQTQTPTQTEMEIATQMEEQTRDFLGLKWGLGIGVMGSFGDDAAIEKASIVTFGSKKVVHVEEEGDFRPQMFMEMHAFLVGPRVTKWREYQRWKDEDRIAKAGGMMTTTRKPAEMPTPPLMGFGPFIAVQGDEDEVIDALAVGFMGGIRRGPMSSNSLNIGIGVSFDPSVQVLAKGFEEGAEVPNDVTAVRFKKEGRFGWALMASFTF